MKKLHQEVLNKEAFDEIMKDLNNLIDQCLKSIRYYRDIIENDTSDKKVDQAKKRLKYESKRRDVLKERLDNFRLDNAEFFI